MFLSLRNDQVRIVLRLLAASVGAYGVTYAATAAVALLLPMHRADAAIVATNFSFLLLTALAFWSLCCRSVVRLWTVLLAAAAGFSVLVVVLR